MNHQLMCGKGKIKLKQAEKKLGFLSMQEIDEKSSIQFVQES